MSCIVVRNHSKENCLCKIAPNYVRLVAPGSISGLGDYENVFFQFSAKNKTLFLAENENEALFQSWAKVGDMLTTYHIMGLTTNRRSTSCICSYI